MERRSKLKTPPAVAVSFLVLVACIGLFVPAAAADALRVCADPDYLPYSNRAGQGFENKIAAEVAKYLNKTVEYTWASYRGEGGFPQFLVTTLESRKCDLVIDVPYGSRDALTTQPYYISSYVFIFKKNKQYDITSMDSPVLKRLKVGIERDTPAEAAIKMRGMIDSAVSFDIGENNGESPATMLQAVESGKVDVVVAWQPAIGGFLHNYSDLEVVPVPNNRTMGAPEQYAFPMAMGVREGDDSLKKQLDDVISQHKAGLTSILEESGVKAYTSETPNVP